ncbi:MAG: class I SAM-dependent methyltransferase [Geminicoccaceae bacterium]
MDISLPCPACGKAALAPFYRVASIPVHSCVLVETREAALAFPQGDLELAFCESCGFIHNHLFDRSRLDYSGEYEETQGYSPRFRSFIDEVCEDQIRRHALGGKTLFEIGCGKGEFLVSLCERSGSHGVGIDPAYRPERTQSAAAEQLTFIQDSFGAGYGPIAADYICCRHTLEHIPDVGDFLRLVREGIGDRRPVTLFFELPDTERVLDERAFWDIYYEHCSYFTPGSLERLFRRAGFEVTRQWKAFDDQYLMLEARPGVSGPASDDAADIERTRQRVAAFSTDVARKLDSLREAVQAWRRTGKTVVIWGSGSKSVGYLTTLGLRDEIKAVVDINPHKHGKYQAGSGHEIVGPDALTEIKPDAVVIMNPIYIEEISADLKRRGLTPEITALG